jgi:hypothetical protein
VQGALISLALVMIQQPESRLVGLRKKIDKCIGDKHEEVCCVDRGASCMSTRYWLGVWPDSQYSDFLILQATVFGRSVLMCSSSSCSPLHNACHWLSSFFSEGRGWCPLEDGF